MMAMAANSEMRGVRSIEAPEGEVVNGPTIGCNGFANALRYGSSGSTHHHRWQAQSPWLLEQRSCHLQHADYRSCEAPIVTTNFRRAFRPASSATTIVCVPVAGSQNMRSFDAAVPTSSPSTNHETVPDRVAALSGTT